MAAMNYTYVSEPMVGDSTVKTEEFFKFIFTWRFFMKDNKRWEYHSMAGNRRDVAWQDLINALYFDIEDIEDRPFVAVEFVRREPIRQKILA